MILQGMILGGDEKTVKVAIQAVRESDWSEVFIEMDVPKSDFKQIEGENGFEISNEFLRKFHTTHKYFVEKPYTTHDYFVEI